MKNLIFGVGIYACILAMPALAEEGAACKHAYETVKRKVNNIKSYGADLSSMAKEKLLDDLKGDTKFCISQCEGEEFKYCNEIAKLITEE